MIILAKDLKTGMTIKDGCWSMTVESISKSFQKNGTPTIIVTGMTKNSRKNKLGKTTAPFQSERTYKELTKINGGV